MENSFVVYLFAHNIRTHGHGERRGAGVRYIQLQPTDAISCWFVYSICETYELFDGYSATTTTTTPSAAAASKTPIDFTWLRWMRRKEEIEYDIIRSVCWRHNTGGTKIYFLHAYAGYRCVGVWPSALFLYEPANDTICRQRKVCAQCAIEIK